MSPLSLELFEELDGEGLSVALPIPEPADHELRQSYEDGFRAGLNAAQAEQQSRQLEFDEALGRLVAEIPAAIQAFRRQAVSDLRVVSTSMLSQILPMVSRHSLPQLVVEALGPAFDASLDAPVILEAPPEWLSVLRHHLPMLTDREIEFVDGANPQEIVLTMGKSMAVVQTGGVIARLEDILNAYFHQQSEVAGHE